MPRISIVDPAKMLYNYKGILYTPYFESWDSYECGDKTKIYGYSSKAADMETASVLGNENFIRATTNGLHFIEAHWGKRQRFKTKAEFGTLVNQEAFVGIGECVYADKTTMHIGFRIVNGTLYGTVANGVAEQTIALMSIVYGTRYKFEYVYTPNTNVKFFVDDILKGTISTGLPDILQQPSYILNAWVRTGDAAMKYIWIGEPTFLQEP